MANKRKHLSDEERFCIEKMCRAGETFVDIGKTLDRGKSTITEEVNGNGGRKKYTAEAAIRRAYWKQYRKKRNCNKVAMDGHLTKFIEKRSGLERFLFWNRNNHKSGRKRENKLYLTDPDRKWIEKRPSEAFFSYGHWEMDFIVSKCNAWVILVCVEKYSKILKISLLPNRQNDLVNETLVSMFRGCVVHSITTDNDVAFGKWKELEVMLGTEIYFCHPYHSREKGLVENSNRWIREFIPKKTDLKSISPLFLLDIENYFNHKPRECLCGYTSYEVMMEYEHGTLVESLAINFPEVRIEG